MSIYTIARRENIDDSDRTLGNVKEALWKVVNREYQKELPSISLNSIDKKCFSELYVACFEQPATIEDFCKNYNVTSKFDQRILNNFQIIYTFLEKSIMINSKNDLLDFADYILQYIQFIVIEASCKENKVFLSQS